MVSTDRTLTRFVKESNAIEGITREPTRKEIQAHESFLTLACPEVSHLEQFVHAIGGGPLRDKPGMDVRVGSHRPIPGGPRVRENLARLLRVLDTYESPWATHVDYERLHPFMDGNGRSGWLVWLWMMEQRELSVAPLGFLHSFYYQTLGGVVR